MTKEQFVRGYLLLTSQPWGKSYRSITAYTDGELAAIAKFSGEALAVQEEATRRLLAKRKL